MNGPPVRVLLSDQIADIDEALTVIHDGFVEAGYMDPNPSGRRVIPHYLTPGIAFSIGHVRGRAVAATAIIPDGAWGLPSEPAFPDEVAALRRRARLLEVGSLVVSRDHRTATRSVYLALVGAAFRAVALRDRDEELVGTVAPEGARFYEHMCGFRPVGPARPLYGAPAVLMRVPAWRALEAVLSASSVTRAVLAGLLTDPHPDWLRSRLSWAPEVPPVTLRQAVSAGAA